MEKRLERHLDEAQIGGVAAGLAHYFNIDRTLIRVLFVAGIFIPSAPALILYIILWIVLPERRFGFSPQTQSTVFSNPAFSMASSDPKRGNLIGGAILIIIGVFALLERYTDIDISDVWPLGLIGFGAWLILKDRDRKAIDNSSTSYLDSDPTPPTPPTPPTNDPYDPNRPINQV
ncbi:PspC domain-containing protein [Fibrella aquatica]|jgi:phage shock protein C|uniref:PspC domain-containing protein n=1 Tax=Fibrella aquatica TaxID=3242487 RepID=UPI003521A301